MLCGTFCQDEACAGLLVQAGLPDMLITLLKGKWPGSFSVNWLVIACSNHCTLLCIIMYTAKQEEDELVLQIVYVFYYLVLYQSTRQSILSTSRILTLLIDTIIILPNNYYS